MSETKRRPRVLLGSTGSVASIKVAALCKLLLEFADVKLVVTSSAKNFIDDADLPDAVKPVLGDEAEWRAWHAVGDPVLHIELRRWADVLVVAPLSANSLAKMAAGMADNLLTCVVRAWDFSKPLLVAPAMNTAMWVSPFTSRHLDTLVQLGTTPAAATPAPQLSSLGHPSTLSGPTAPPRDPSRGPAAEGCPGDAGPGGPEAAEGPASGACGAITSGGDIGARTDASAGGGSGLGGDASGREATPTATDANGGGGAATSGGGGGGDGGGDSAGVVPGPPASRVVVVAPVSKRLACGDEGTGAMAAPDDIAATCLRALRAFVPGVVLPETAT